MKNERSIDPSRIDFYLGNASLSAFCRRNTRSPYIEIILAQTKKLSDILFRYERQT